jgi:hypothetical protein
MSKGHCMDIIRFRLSPGAVLIDKDDSSANAAHHERVRSRRTDKATSDNSSFHRAS